MSYFSAEKGSRGRRRRPRAPEADDRDQLTGDLVRQLARRERTRQEMVTYLRRRGYLPDLIEEAVSRAVGEGLIDDRRYAQMYLRDRRRLRPMAGRAVLRELRERGVSPAEAEEVLAASDPPWDDTELAWDAISGRFRRWAPETRWQRASGFLRRRGFGSDVIRATLERMSEEAPPDDEDVH